MVVPCVPCFVTAHSITQAVIQPGGPFSVKQKSPCLILNYDPRIELQIVEKILKPFAKEEDLLVGVVDNRNGTMEVSLHFVVDCSPPPELDIRSIKSWIFKGKGFIPAMSQKAIRERKMIVQRFVSGTEADFPAGDVRMLLQLRNIIGYFLICIGIASRKGSLIHPEWYLEKREFFSSKKKLRQFLERKCELRREEK